MANYQLDQTGEEVQAILDAVQDKETTRPVLNSSKLITSGAVRNALAEGYLLKGVADHTTNPGTPTEKVFYIASDPGTYSNFGTGISVAEGEVAILKYDTAWHKEVTGAATAAQVTELGQQVINNYFTGEGQTYVSQKIVGLTPGRRYRLYLYSTIWDTTGITGASSYKFHIAYNYGAGAGTNITIYYVYLNGTPNSYYDFLVPDDLDINYFYIGGRAVIGEKVRFQILDITDIESLRQSIKELGQEVWNSSLIGNADNIVYKDIYGLIPGKAYRIEFKNPNWDMTGVTINTSNYRFVVDNEYGGNYSHIESTGIRTAGDMPTSMDFVVPSSSSSCRFYIRAAVGENVEFNIFEITDSGFLGTKWFKVFGKEDYDYKARYNYYGHEGIGGYNYIYIFNVNDIVFLTAGISDNYVISTGIYDTLLKAKTLRGGNYFGRGVSASANIQTQYRMGKSSVKRGYLAVGISRKDGEPLTDADVTTIENDLYLSFYPVKTQGEVNILKDKVSRLLGDSITTSDLELFATHNSGDPYQSLDRVKFLQQDAVAGTLLSVNIDSLLISIPNLVYAAEVQRTLEGTYNSGGATRLQAVIATWINTPTTNALITTPGYLDVYFKKSDGSAFSFTEIEAIRNNALVSIKPEVHSSKIDSDKEHLPLGTFTRAEGTGETLTPSTKIVSSSYLACVPRVGIKYYCVAPLGIQVRIVYGNNITLGYATSWLDDGDMASLPDSALIQRLQFQKSNGNDLTVGEIEAFVSSGVIGILYDRRDLQVNERNYQSEQYVKSTMCRLGFEDAADRIAHAGLHDMPVLVHISDSHGDIQRIENAFKYAGILKADNVVNTGDSVVYNGIDGSGFLADIISENTTPLLNVIGNHECNPPETFDNDDLFQEHISPFVTQGNYLSALNTPATMPYYYVDIATKSLRIIVLNQFDDGCYGSNAKGGRLGQSQVTWFLNTLLSTPAGYGVVVAMHSPEDRIVTPEEFSAWNQTVNWDGRDEDTYGYCVNGLYVNTMRPIKTIIDAFIEKLAISTSYTENTINGNTGETVNIVADFSAVATGVEFICYLCGHRHLDNVGYLESASNRQLCINITTTNCHYPRSTGISFAEITDLPRGDSGVTQDAFNVIAIDRQNGRVKIARVGSAVNLDGTERRFLLAPYRI